ncbi:MAG: PIN domain-containing protein [Nitrospirae bacterium]|nr:PIN domain-containing protein [Nitrospirota bacterium]
MDKILVDTSAWIEFFRKKSPYYHVISELIDSGSVVCAGIVFAELLQGAKSGRELSTIKEFLHVFDFLPESGEIWEEAGELSYELRRKGKSAGLSDCLIASLVKTNNLSLLTLDRHFDLIQKETGMRLVKI